MARMPGADWLGEHSPRTPMSRYDIFCVHTIVGFAPAHAAHFSTWMSGRLGQSRDTAFRSAANLHGNHRIIACENEDAAKDIPLTDAQVAANARAYHWTHEEHGIPLQMCPDSRPDSRGLAYHRQGIDGNFGGFRFPGRVPGGEVWSSSFGKVCPRDVRIAQLPDILDGALTLKRGGSLNQEDDFMNREDKQWLEAQFAKLATAEDLQKLHKRVNEVAKSERIRDREEREGDDASPRP